jgi:hypothetical protein
MNRQLLIDPIVRQTMILIAQLATTGGVRAPLAHLADRVFLELARELEAQGLSRKVSAHGLTHFLWLLIYREGPLTRAALLQRARAEAPRVEEALERLRSSGRISLQGAAYSCLEVVVHQHDPAGWEAAMLDHFQALVKTLCSRLRGQGGPHPSGGSTYSFDVGPEHPLAAEVYGQLQRLRSELSALRARVGQHNSSHPHDAHELVTIYVGQHVQGERSDGDAASINLGSNVEGEAESSRC